MWGPVSGTRTGSVRSPSAARELYSSRPKPAPRAEDATDAAHTEMFSSLQCSSCALRIWRIQGVRMLQNGKPAPQAEDAADAAHSEMFSSVQCYSFALRRRIKEWMYFSQRAV